jgi:hypothetical protein
MRGYVAITLGHQGRDVSGIGGLHNRPRHPADAEVSGSTEQRARLQYVCGLAPLQALVRSSSENRLTVRSVAQLLKRWRRDAHVPWQPLGHGCKGLPPQPMIFAKEEPLDDHHHYRL